MGKKWSGSGSTMRLFRSRSSDSPEVVDLRTSAEGPSGPPWGSPSNCPYCHGRGYLDHVDLFDEIMYLHCTACEEKFVLTRAQTDAARPSA